MIPIVKKIIFWNYGRTTWQYDVLCALILAFIFLTPKSWFASELPRPAGHQTAPPANTLLLTWPVGPHGYPATQEVEQCVRRLPGYGGAHVREVRSVRDEAGTVIAYQVDIE